MFLLDRNSTQTCVVASSESEAAILRSSISHVSADISVRVVSVHEAVHTVRPNATISFLDTLARHKRNGKHLMQSIKKLYGCIALGTLWCFATDSESFLVRPTDFRTVIELYAEKMAVFHNSRYIGGCGHSSENKILPMKCLGYHASVPQAAQDALGVQCNGSIAAIGYSNELYSWFWERQTLLDFVRYNVLFGKDILDMAREQVVVGSTQAYFLFVEEAINQFRACTNRDAYTWVDVAHIIDKMTQDNNGRPRSRLRDEVMGVSGVYPFLEVSGKYIGALTSILPMYTAQMASVFKYYHIPTYSASGTYEDFSLSRDYIELSGIHVCTSWCSEELFRGFVEGKWPVDQKQTNLKQKIGSGFTGDIKSNESGRVHPLVVKHSMTLKFTDIKV